MFLAITAPSTAPMMKLVVAFFVAVLFRYVIVVLMVFIVVMMLIIAVGVARWRWRGMSAVSGCYACQRQRKHHSCHSNSCGFLHILG